MAPRPSNVQENTVSIFKSVCISFSTKKVDHICILCIGLELACSESLCGESGQMLNK